MQDDSTPKFSERVVARIDRCLGFLCPFIGHKWEITRTIRPEHHFTTCGCKRCGKWGAISDPSPEQIQEWHDLNKLTLESGLGYVFEKPYRRILGNPIAVAQIFN